MGLLTRKPAPSQLGRFYHEKTRHFNIATLLPIKYLSSDRIMTWSVHRFCSSSRCFTSSFQICDLTNTCWVAIENPLILCTMCHYFTATEPISVGSQIWKREVKERLERHNQYNDHVLLQSELKYWIGAKVAGTVKWNRSPGTTQPNNCGFMPGPGNNSGKTERFGLLGVS
jgi:hypothetical protein